MITKSIQKGEQTNENSTQEINCFEDFKLSHDLLRGIYGYGFQSPSPIQKKAIIPIIQGRDLIGQSQAGTGKTGAFTVGALQRIDQQSEYLQVIILAPTRELSLGIHQVIKNLKQFTKIRSTVLIGGTNVRESINELKQLRPHLIVATPGRCKDFIEKKRLITDHLKIMVLDEADEMLDRGFVEQVKEIFSEIPMDTQILLFSATMPQEIVMMTEKFMKDPFKILLKTNQVPVESIKQFTVSMENYDQKFPTMVHIYKNISVAQSIIFANTKEKVSEIANKLKELNFPISVIHSEVEDRTGALNEFKSGKTRILVSTDLTGRGIDISQVSLVINYDLPCSSTALQQYIHRIGRCGRYGKKGVAINLVTEGDAEIMVRIQKFYNIEVPELPLDLERVFN